ncbi:MAG TPA: tetratricopeptide repeat protein [Pyrinomonadaceae bacterium]|jgi:DNA-binding winged helix-turn-helix (wHTH) protein/TolB-like protein/Flp pilus assembly protein TadD|nr:tetratricopeptide repeat protein [Pyrinomonadaceae bacterium]
MSAQNARIYEFGPFRLDAQRRRLLREGEAVPLKPKDFDTLLALVEQGGHVLPREVLMERVWPGSFVEEGNLSLHISNLRKALGEKRDQHKYIVTVPGQGYEFVADVRELQRNEPELPVTESSTSLHTEDLTPGHYRPGTFTQNKTRLFATISLVLALGVGGYYYKTRKAMVETSTGVKSIAVLPFKPLAAADRDETLELGMADTLITSLSNIKGLTVRPTSAVRRYSGLEQDAIVAGRELQVEAVIEGNIQRSGDRVRVNARLIRIADGTALWAEQFDVKFGDIFSVQDLISQRLTSTFSLRLTGEEKELISKRRTDNWQAYEAFLKGRYFYGGPVTQEGLQKSIDYFEQAIKLDPNYAEAYAGLANAYIRGGSVWGFLSPRETFPKAEPILKKALELDESLADAHASLARYRLYYEWDWTGAENEFKRAIELNPNVAIAHHEYASLLQVYGQFDKAVAEREIARRLDPLSPNAVATVGYPHYFAGRYDEAIKHFQQALELDPSFSWSHLWIGQIYLETGKLQQGIDEIQKAVKLSGGNTRAIATLGYAYAVAGKRNEALKVIANLQQLAKEKYVSPYYIAVIHAGLNNRDQAFIWLEKAFDERQPYLTLLNYEPFLVNLRGDARFDDLRKRIGLVR